MKSIPLTISPEGKVFVHAPAAHILIAPLAAGEQPRFEVKRPEQWRIEEKNGGVLLDLTHLALWKAGDQSGRLFIPEGVSLQIKMSAGHIRGAHLRLSALDLETQSGHIELHDVHASLRLRTAMGTIRARDLVGSIDAETNLGEIKLGILGLVPGEHRVRANMGAIRVWLAPGLDLCVEANAPMGSVRCRYPSRPNGEAVLHLQADVGAIRVREADAAPPEPRDWLDPEAWLEWATLRFSPPRRPPPPRPFRPFFGAPFGPIQAFGAMPPAAQSRGAIDETELRKILDLVKEKKISIEEAEQLISALDG